MEYLNLPDDIIKIIKKNILNEFNEDRKKIKVELSKFKAFNDYRIKDKNYDEKAKELIFICEIIYKLKDDEEQKNIIEYKEAEKFKRLKKNLLNEFNEDKRDFDEKIEEFFFIIEIINKLIDAEEKYKLFLELEEPESDFNFRFENSNIEDFDEFDEFD